MRPGSGPRTAGPHASAAVSFHTGSQPDFMKTASLSAVPRWALWNSQKEKAFLKFQTLTLNTREPVLKDRSRVLLKGANSDMG